MRQVDRIRREVKEGAAWLDARYPKWEERINLDSLNLDSTKTCILGQLEGDYWAAVGKLGLDSREQSKYGFIATIRRFTNSSIWEEMQLLTETWKNYILKRRATKEAK